MSDEFDPFKPGTGLKSDFDATIIDALFVKGDYGSNLQLLTDDNGEEFAIQYALGRGWDFHPGGEQAFHPNGEKELFRNDSRYSQFIVHAMEAGAREVMYQRNKELENQGPKTASMWVGLRFHWDMVPIPSREPVRDEMGQNVKDDNGRDQWRTVMVDRLMPTKFLGVADQQQLPVSSSPALAPSVSSSDPLSALDNITGAKIRKIGKEAADYMEFLDAMLELTDANGDGILDVHEQIKVAATTDDSWYNALHG